MPIATPITRQTFGRTFTAAISVLGAGALAQLAVVCWAFVAKFHAPVPVIVAEVSDDARGSEIPTLARLTKPEPTADFTADPLGEVTAQSPTAPVKSAPVPPKPTPIPAQAPKPPDPLAADRFVEMLEQGKMLRERGDTGAALTKFREAQALDARNPRAIAEIAMTYEKMGLADRANEQWKRIYDLGETAGVFFAAAEAKLKAAQASEMAHAIAQPQPAQEETSAIARGATLGLAELRIEEMRDPAASKKFTLRVPIKARVGTRIDASDLVIQVHFFDVVDSSRVERTSANVSSRWATTPPDWADTDTEELAVQYELPADKRNRKYFGYLVRLYYKGALQAAIGTPDSLVQKYPAPPVLQTDANP